MNQVLFFSANTVYSENWSTLENWLPLWKRLSSSLSDSLILKVFFLLSFLVRTNPLVKVRTAGVEFWFGPAEFWFSVVHPHSSILSPPPPGAGAGRRRPVKWTRTPTSACGRAATLPFLLVLKALDCTLTPQACQPQPQVGWWGHLAKDLHFPQNQHDTTQQMGGSHSLQEPQLRPPSRKALPDLFGADLPKAMPYWFCTNRVHLWVSCLPGVRFGFFFFPPFRANRAKKSSTH